MNGMTVAAQPFMIMRTILILAMLCWSCATHAQQTPTTEQMDPMMLYESDHPVRSEMIIYPNPASYRARVLWDDRSLVRMPVEIRSMDGRLVRLDSLSPAHELDVSDLEEGFYRLFLMDLSGIRAQATFRIER